jgi:glycosyltransferase involved in cell wall biosynthesis
MRITLAAGPCFPVPPVRGGGMARAMFDLARAFAAQGHPVTLLARAWPGQPPEELLHGVRILRHGGFDSQPSTAANLALDFIDAARLVPRLPRADILLCNDFWLPALAPILKPAAGAVAVSVNRFPKGQFFLYHRARAFISPSRAIAGALAAQAPWTTARTTIIPNPIDTSVFHPDDNIPRTPGSILYAGRLHPEKGVHLLLEAFRTLHTQRPATTLTLAGPHSTSEGGGGEAYLARLRELARGLPVTFTGPVHEARALADLYRQHSVFCYPSLADRGESFGLAPLEAMACGAVPIVSANPVFRDFLEPGVHGFTFDHHAPDPAGALATALTRTLDAPAALRSTAGERARAFDAACLAQRWLQCFQRLLP